MDPKTQESKAKTEQQSDMSSQNNWAVSKPKRRSGLIRLFTFILVFGAIGGAWLLFAKADTPTTPDGYKLLWADEFNGTSVDTSKWNIYTGTLDYDQACYTSNQGSTGNIEETGGNLIIRTKKETSCQGAKYAKFSDGDHYTTGYVKTSGDSSANDKYRVSPLDANVPSGVVRMDMRAQMPITEPGVWPGLWTRNAYSGTGTNPYGELDLIERWGDEKNNMTYQSSVWNGTKHTGGDVGYIDNEKCPIPATNPPLQNNCDDLTTDMHIYSVEIDSKKAQIRYYLDGRLTTTMSASTNPGFDASGWLNSINGKWDIRLMTQVTADNNDWGDTPPNASTFQTAELKIDYVRVYDVEPAGSTTTPPPADTTAPTVAITAPTANAKVNGTVAVAATASDNTGVSKVQFSVDGVLQTPDDTSAPYGFNWNTTGVANGNHTISAVAVDAAGNKSTQASTTVNVQAADTTVPSVAVTSPVDGAKVSGTVNVAATASDNVAVSKVQYFVDGVQQSPDDTSAPYIFSWNTTGLKNGSHVIAAEAVDSSSNRSQRSSVSVDVENGDTVAPSAATSLTSTAPDYKTVKLAWTAATDNTGVTGYYLVRNGVTVATLGAVTSYTDATANASTQYSYYLIAFDAAGNLSANSAATSVTTPNTPDTTAPSVPSGLSATAASPTQVNLTWAASTDNVGVTGYDVYRGGTKVATITTTSYGDSDLTPGTAYSYTVRSRDAAGNTSGDSNTASATTQTVVAVATTGILKGVISKDETGTPISSGAFVSTYVNGARQRVRSNSQGYYYFPGLPASTYNFKFAISGRTPQYLNSTIVGGQSTTLNVSLVRTASAARK